MRDVQRLRSAAKLVADDLRRTLPGTWSCSVGSDYVLTVTGAYGEERVLLEEMVAEGFWPDEERSASLLDGTLNDDASELIAGEVAEVLRVWGHAWPTCCQHGELLTSCSGVWVCDGPPPHDISLGGVEPAAASAC